MFKNISSWIKENCVFLSIFISVTLLIFMQSYFFGAYISPDSTNYLRAAQSLRDGYGFRMNAAAGDTESYFSVWPIGYPAMIAFVSKITNTEIYLSSKILSAVILTIIFMMIYIRFRKNAWLYALIGVNMGFLRIFYYTWSEQPFILGLIWISFTSIDILESEHIKYHHYISICLASLFLFLSRYIGTFSIGIIGILAVYHFAFGILGKKREYIKKAVLLFTIAAIVTGFAIIYFFYNLKYSGYLTGIARAPISDNPFVLFLRLCQAQIVEMENVFYGFFVMSHGIAFTLYILCAIMVFRFLHKNHRTFYRYIPVSAFSFLLIGLLYWLSIVAMRFSAQFDGFGYRLLFPASMLFIWGIFSIIEHYHNMVLERINCGIKRYILTFAIILSLLFPLARPLYNAVFMPDQNNGYQKRHSGIINDLRNVPTHSLVITVMDSEKRNTNFIRPDLFFLKLNQWDLSVIFSSLEQFNEVYLYADWYLVSNEVKRYINSRYNGILDFEEKVVRIK